MATRVATLEAVLSFRDEFSRKLKAAEGGIASFGKKATQAGRKLSLGVTAPLTAAGFVALSTAKDFDKVIKSVQAVAKAGGAADDTIESLKKTAIEFGKKGVFGPLQVAEAMQDMVRDGLTPAQIEGGQLATVMDLAAAAGAELALAQVTLSDTMQAFGLQTKDATRISDVFAGVLFNTPVVLRELGVTMAIAGPAAASLGVTLEDLAVATGLMADAGIRGSNAGTALRRGLLNIVAPSGEAKGALKALGIQAFDSKGKFTSLTGIVAQLRDKTRGMTDQQKAQTLATIFGARAVSAWSVILDATTQEIDNMAIAVRKTGVAQEIAEEQTKGLEGSMTKAKASVTAMQIELVNAFEPQIKSAAAFIKQLADVVSNLSEGQRKAIVVIAAMAAALGPLLIMLGLVAKSVIILKTVILAANPILAAIVIAIAAITAVTIKAAAEFGSFQLVFKALALTALRAMNNIRLAVINTFEKMVVGAFEVATALGDNGLGQALQQARLGLIAMRGDALNVNKAIDGMFPPVKGAVTATTELAVSTEELTSTLTNLEGEAVGAGGGLEGLGADASEAGDKVDSALTTIDGLLGKFVNTVKDFDFATQEGFNGFLDLLQDSKTSLESFASTFERNESRISSSFDKAVSAARTTVSKLADDIKSAQEKLTGLDKGFADKRAANEADARQKVGELFVRTEEDIAALREQLLTEENAERAAKLQAQIAEKQAMLDTSLTLEQGFIEAIDLAKADAARTELERILFAANRKKEALAVEQAQQRAAVVARIELLREEKAVAISQLDAVLARRTFIEQSITDLLKANLDARRAAVEGNIANEETLIAGLKVKWQELANTVREAFKSSFVVPSGITGGALPVTTVNDAVIAPNGNVVSTDPNDFLIATKNPAGLGGGGGIVINITGNQILAADADGVALQIGDKLIERLGMQLRIA